MIQGKTNLGFWNYTYAAIQIMIAKTPRQGHFEDRLTSAIFATMLKVIHKINSNQHTRTWRSTSYHVNKRVKQFSRLCYWVDFTKDLAQNNINKLFCNDGGTQPRSQALSSLPSWSVGQMTTQTLGGKRSVWQERWQSVLIVVVTNVVGFKSFVGVRSRISLSPTKLNSNRLSCCFQFTIFYYFIRVFTTLLILGPQ